jgi:hypothetical protein
VAEVTLVSCASGPGIIRAEVWEDDAGEVVRYNLAFIITSCIQGTTDAYWATTMRMGRIIGTISARLNRFQ